MAHSIAMHTTEAQAQAARAYMGTFGMQWDGQPEDCGAGDDQPCLRHWGWLAQPEQFTEQAAKQMQALSNAGPVMLSLDVSALSPLQVVRVLHVVERYMRDGYDDYMEALRDVDHCTLYPDSVVGLHAVMQALCAL